MKYPNRISSLVLAAAGIAASSLAGSASAQTAFTYQGVLSESGSPVTGLESIRFRIYTAQSGGTLIGETTQNVDVADGVFSTQLNFGPLNTIDPTTAWLEIGVETSPGTYETLGRQQITSAPFSTNTRGLDVNASGNVGIGADASNTYKLLLDGGSSLPMQLEGVTPGLRLLADNSAALGTAWTIFQDSATGDLTFRDSWNGITRMTIDSGNGRVGIGNTNPAATLDVNGTGNFSGSVGIGTTPTASDRLAVVGTNGATFNVFNVPTNVGRQLVGGFFADNAGPYARFQQIQGGTYADIGLSPAGNFDISIDSQPWVTVKPDGNVGIGVANPDFPLTIDSLANGGSIRLNSNTGGSDWHFDFTGIGLDIVETGVAARVALRDGGDVVVPGRTRFGTQFGAVSATTQIFGRASDTFAMVVGDPTGIFRLSVNNNGAVATQCGIICASDERLKEDIVDLESPLEKIMALRDVTFTWKDETLAKRGTQIGFVAQEVQKVLPELIGETPDGMLGVDYASMAPVLVGGIQEQQTQIDTMQSQIADLQAQIESLQNQRSMTGASMIWPALIGGGLVCGIALARRRMHNA